MNESSEINLKANVCVAFTIHSPVCVHNPLTVDNIGKKGEIQNSMTRPNRDLGTAAKTQSGEEKMEKECEHGPLAWVTHADNKTEQKYLLIADSSELTLEELVFDMLSCSFKLCCFQKEFPI